MLSVGSVLVDDDLKEIAIDLESPIRVIGELIPRRAPRREQLQK